PARDRERAAVVDELLQLFANLEERQSFRRYRHRLAGSRISTAVGLVRTDRKAPESANLDALAMLERLRHGVEHAVDHELRPGLRQLPSARDRIDQLALRHVHSPALPVCPKPL